MRWFRPSARPYQGLTDLTVLERSPLFNGALRRLFERTSGAKGDMITAGGGTHDRDNTWLIAAVRITFLPGDVNRWKLELQAPRPPNAGHRPAALSEAEPHKVVADHGAWKTVAKAKKA